MKKLLEILTDAFLFSFLLIIFLIPLLVSFNLDPKLFVSEAQKVSGVSDDVRDITTSNLTHFNFEEDFEKSDRISILDSSKKNNLYEVIFEITKGDELNDTIRFGNIVNESSNPIRFNLNLIAQTQPLEGIKIWIRLDEKVYTIFNGENFEDVEFELAANAEEELKVELISNFAINYPIELTLQLRSINSV